MIAENIIVNSGLTYYVFICEGEYEAGAIGVVAESESHAVEMILEYSRKREAEYLSRPNVCSPNSDGYDFYIKPGGVLTDHNDDYDLARNRALTTWVLDRSASIAVKDGASTGIKFHVFHDG